MNYISKNYYINIDISQGFFIFYIFYLFYNVDLINICIDLEFLVLISIYIDDVDILITKSLIEINIVTFRKLYNQIDL